MRTKAESSPEYVIINGALEGEQYYLKSVSKDKVKDLLLENGFGSEKIRKGRKWKSVESLDEEKPRGQTTATWTKDPEEAMYFQSRKEAEKLISKWHILRHAGIMQV